MNFKNQVVLITGSGSGIGKTAAFAYAAAGAKIVVSDINTENGEAVAAEIVANGGQAIFIAADVANHEAVKNLIQKAFDHYGQIDVAVNNAGIGSELSKTSSVKLEDWDKVVAVNQTGVFYCMREELKVMEKQGSGNIVNIASMAGLKGLPNQIAYTASKHAVIGMTKAAALEYTRQPIRINAVCPVFTNSPMLETLFQFKKGIKEQLVHTIPMRRYGETKEIVDAIMWISSNQSTFVTGLALPVDGGMSA